MSDEERFQRLTDALQRFGNMVGEMLPPMFDAVTRALEEMERLLWEEYRRHGAPYGETDEGFRCWWVETGEAAQRAEKESTEAAWQRALSSLRERPEGT